MRRYAIVVEKAKSNYAAFVPDSPGCVATGPTDEETERLPRGTVELGSGSRACVAVLER